MKTYRRLFERLASFENLHAAYRAARRGKRACAEVARFELDCEERILGIRRDLLDGTYRFGPYREFMVREPKERRVAAAPFRDRVVHHALVRVLEPVFEPRFVHDTYACRRRRGTHRAVLRCQRFARRYTYVLKADVRKFYASVDHAVLLAVLARRVRDARVLALTRDVLATYTTGVELYRPFPGDDLLSPLRPRGIPIGNLTSQLFANVYLGELDTFAKRSLRVGAYVRYMDDLLLFADDRTTLRAGVRRFVRRTRRQMRAVEAGRLEPAALRRAVRGWVSHAAFGDSRGLRRAILPRLVGRGRGGWTGKAGPGAAGRFLEQRHHEPALRAAQQQRSDESQQQHRVPVREDVFLARARPAAASRGERQTSTVRSRPPRGRREPDGPPCGRPVAEARRPQSP